MKTTHINWRINTQCRIKKTHKQMHVRQNEGPSAVPPPAAAPEPSAPKAPCTPHLGVYGRRVWTDGRTDGRRHPPTSRPWFYPVVEQHDVTYHRVKPLTWHRRQRHNAKPNRKKKWEHRQQKNDNIYRKEDPEHSKRRGQDGYMWGVDVGVE